MTDDGNGNRFPAIYPIPTMPVTSAGFSPELMRKISDNDPANNYKTIGELIYDLLDDVTDLEQRNKRFQLKIDEFLVTIDVPKE